MTVWLFDLDNTLHDASHAIFPQITANMNAFIAEMPGRGSAHQALEDADRMRLDYWRRYGATILGLVKHHGVKPEAFLQAAHRFDDLRALLRSERGLRQALKRLPGKKIMFTNAPRAYSRDVLRNLGLHRCFGRHISIESMYVHGQLSPKPSKKLLRKVLAREKVLPQACILVEDNDVALKAARKTGMITVLVSQYIKKDDYEMHASPRLRRSTIRSRAAYIDIKVKSVKQLPDYWNRWK